MAQKTRGEKMTITVSEFRRDMTHYERVALKDPVFVENTKEGILFKVEAKSLMEARLDDMKAGNGISLAEFTAIPI